MVCRIAFCWTLATLTILGARTVSADPMSFTGDVAKDFDPSLSSVHVSGPNELFDDPNPLNRIYQLPEMTDRGLINGYAIQDIRTHYDATSDTLAVGLNTYSIAGSAVGAGGADMEALLAEHGGVDPPHLGGRKSITVAFAPNNPDGSNTPGAPILVAGVPADKSAAGPGLDGFTVARYKGLVSQGIEQNYGATLPNNLGALAYDPSKDHPGFEFTVANFSKIAPGLDPTRGFWIQAYAGSPDDNPIGEERTKFVYVPGFSPDTIPEPATLLAWTFLAGVAVLLRNRGGE